MADPQVAPIGENFHLGGFLVSEARGKRSREVGTITVEKLKTGAVLGKIAVAGVTSAAFAGNTGDGAMGAITGGAGRKAGVYKLVIIEPAANAGKFTVEDPDGIVIGVGTVAVAFSAGGLAFTLADGAADFIAGDGFNLTVAAGSGKYVAYDPDGTDGRQLADAILFGRIGDEVDATVADKVATIIQRDAEVNTNELVWGAGVDANEQAAGLARLKSLYGIIAR